MSSTEEEIRLATRLAAYEEAKAAIKIIEDWVEGLVKKGLNLGSHDWKTLAAIKESRPEIKRGAAWAVNTSLFELTLKTAKPAVESTRQATEGVLPSDSISFILTIIKGVADNCQREEQVKGVIAASLVVGGTIVHLLPLLNEKIKQI